MRPGAESVAVIKVYPDDARTLIEWFSSGCFRIRYHPGAQRPNSLRARAS